MSNIHIHSKAGSFSYDMKTRSYTMSHNTSPIVTVGYDVVEVVPEWDREFYIKVDIIFLLSKLEVI